MGSNIILETQITVNEADKTATKCIKGDFDMYRMLIVDDEKNERDCILYLLKNSDLPLEIREAEDGVTALALLKGWPAHI